MTGQSLAADRVTVQAANQNTGPVVIDVNVGDGIVRCHRSGTGPHLVFLHGWTLDHRSWTPQSPLNRQFTLIMPDRRGFGQSTAPANLDQEWQDVDRLTPAERFVLIGMSQGASVALDYARQRPGRVAALMLVGAPLHGVIANAEEEYPIPRDRYATRVQQGDLASMKADWRRHPLAQVSYAAQPLLDAMLNDYDGRDLLAPSSTIAISADDIRALPMPVLAVTGDDDTPWRRRVSHFIGDNAPQGRVVSIKGAGHLCNIDNPTRFNELLAELMTFSTS